MTTAFTIGRAPSSAPRSRSSPTAISFPLLLGRERARLPTTAISARSIPGIANVFSTAAFRVGHTMLSPQLLRLDAHESFHRRSQSRAMLLQSHARSADPASNPTCAAWPSRSTQEVDCYLVDGVRNFLFGPPGAGGFDLASLNIQRGRDHGLPRYNAARLALGLARQGQLCRDDFRSGVADQTRRRLRHAGRHRRLGRRAGRRSRQRRPGRRTFLHHPADQFTRLRDGDRFWYQTLSAAALSSRNWKRKRSARSFAATRPSARSCRPTSSAVAATSIRHRPSEPC